MARLTAPNGATVEVAAERVENLLRYGFTEAKSETEAPAKKAASSKSSKSEK